MSVDILIGDCRDVLGTLPSGMAHTCVTSPPYFRLRDYECAEQIGLEATPEAYVAALVEVFRGVRRVLRNDGTVWLVIGDSYASAPGQASRGGAPSVSSTLEGNGHRGGGPKLAMLPRVGLSGNKGAASADIAMRPCGPGIKPKDLIGIPWMVAFALRADGWYLRKDIIWSKPNPMPESVDDRPTTAHEYLFLLSKCADYYYDADAIAEEAVYSGLVGQDASGFKDPGQYAGKHSRTKGLRPNHGHTPASRRYESCDQSGRPTRSTNGKRNKRSVWTVATAPFAGAHFATFPPKLIDDCILAGCPGGGHRA